MSTVARSAKGKILIVEDDEGVAHLHSIRLQRCGHSVTTVRSAEEALTAVEREHFDLAILDYGLEGDINGISLFMILRERGFAIPAILVTGFEDPRIIVQAMRAGVRDFLPKTPVYLDDLPLSVERVMHQVALERQVAESAEVREKQELLEAAFDAARLASFVWDLAWDELKWSGHCAELFGFHAEEQCKTFAGLIAAMHPEDRAEVEDTIRRAREQRLPFENQFRVNSGDGSLRWLSARGRFYYGRDGDAVRMIAVMSDITKRKESELEIVRSHEHIKALNDRLQLDVVETHHRTKNSLQNVISLLHLNLRQQGSLNSDEVKKLTAHIQGLAAIHDVMVTQAKEEGDLTMVALDDVFGKVLEVLAKSCGGRTLDRSLDPCLVTSRQAASLTVILNELVSNAVKHGSGKIVIRVEVQDGRGRLMVCNEGSQFPPHFDVEATNRTGLLLIRTLAVADLGGEPDFQNLSETTAAVSVHFPLVCNATEIAASVVKMVQ